MLRQTVKDLKTPWGIIITVLLLFSLQGCNTPFVNVDVKVGEKCGPGKENGVGLCPQNQVPQGGGTYGGTSCSSGWYCTGSGNCPRGQTCKTKLQGGSCVCQCT